MLFQEGNRIDNLKVFGCGAFESIHGQVRNTKVGDTSVMCVMVGYDDTRKAYRLFNRNNSSVVVSASCWFDETTFPFRQESFEKVQQLMPKATAVIPAVPGAIGESLKPSKDADDPPKEQIDNLVLYVEEMTANETAIDISSDEDGGDTEPDNSNPNNLIDALVYDTSHDCIEKSDKDLPPAEKTSADNGVK